MSRDRTIEKVMAMLTSQLLPMEGLREIAVKNQFFRVDLYELMAEKTDEQFVITSYQRILGRHPEKEGISNWLGHLHNGSMTRVELVRQLVDSDEGQARKVLVPGLSTSSKATHTKGKKSLWKMGRRSKKSDSLDKPDSVTFDQAIRDVESQIRELAEQCLYVLEHIEHRFSKFQLPKLAAQTPSKIAFQQTREVDQDRLRLLYETMRSRTPQIACSQIQLAVCEIHRMVASDTEATTGLKGWVLAGDEILDLVAGCVAKNIPVLSTLTSSLCVDFAEFLGVDAVEKPLDAWLTTCDSHAVQVVWLRDRLRMQSDSNLLRCLEELARVITKNGYLIVDEPILENSFAYMRMISAIEVSGFKQDLSEVAQCLKRCDANSSASTVVFRKNNDPRGVGRCEI